MFSTVKHKSNAVSMKQYHNKGEVWKIKSLGAKWATKRFFICLQSGKKNFFVATDKFAQL